MDREHVKGAADKAKGAIKDTAGKLTGDKELQSEGKLDKAKGDVHNAVGNVAIGANDDDQHNPKLNSEPPSNSCLAAIR